MENPLTCHIYFCCNNASYARHYVVLMVSILANLAKEARASFHLIYSGLSQGDLDAFTQMKQYRECDLDFIQVKESDFSHWNQDAGIKHLTVGAYYRIKIPELAPSDVARAVYFDGDIVVDGDISPLWEIDLKGYSAGVVFNGPDNLKKNPDDYYFNSGMIVFNLDEIRAGNFKQEVEKAYTTSGNRGFCDLDQGLLNATWKERVRYLPFTWNLQTACLKVKNRFQYKLGAFLKKPVVLHYTGAHKPWSPRCKNPLWKKYFKYLQFTPYRISFGEYLLFNLQRLRYGLYSSECLGEGRWRIQFFFIFQITVHI